MLMIGLGEAGKTPEKGDLIIIDQLLPEWHWMKIYEGRMGIVTHIREFHYSEITWYMFTYLILETFFILMETM